MKIQLPFANEGNILLTPTNMGRMYLIIKIYTKPCKRAAICSHIIQKLLLPLTEPTKKN